MSAEGERCTSCRFAEPAVGDDDQPRLDCHRYPPVVVGYNDEGTITEMYPCVNGTDWCGEWAPPEPEVS